VDNQLRDDILLHTGFSHVNSLGKYLGANLTTVDPLEGLLSTLSRKSKISSVGGNINV